MSKQKQHYKYRPQKEYSKGLPLHKRLIRILEKWNKVIFLRLLGKILRIYPLDGPLPLEKISSVLIIRYDALGDMIVTSPLWRILKRYNPSIKIGVAGSFKNLDLLRSDPDIDFLYDYTASSMRDFIRLSKITRNQKWDVVLMGNFNQKTRNAIISRLASSDGITATVGTPNAEGHQHLFSRLVSLPSAANKMPMTEQLQYLLRSVVVLPAEEYERPSIRLNPSVESLVKDEATRLLAYEGCTKYIIVNIDAPQFKKWGLENNVLLAKYISRHYPEYVTFVTSLPENQELIARELSRDKIARVRYFPTSSIQEMGALIRSASIVITPDTSIVHLAVAENKPVLAFYLTAGEWLPYNVPAYVILPKKGDPISSIPFDEVKKGIDVLLVNNAHALSIDTIIMDLGVR